MIDDDYGSTSLINGTGQLSMTNHKPRTIDVEFTDAEVLNRLTLTQEH